MNIDQCPECGKLLTALDIRHGWITVQVGRTQARVHTVCRERFKTRSFDEQKARAERAA